MASMAPVAPDRAVSAGRVFSRAFATIGSNPGTMFGIALLFGALPGALVSLGSQQLRAPLEQGGLGVASAVVLGIASGLVGIVLASITQGALVRATVAYSEGRRASFGESVSAGLRVALPLIGLGILLGLGVGLGLVMLFVPGVMLYVMWSVASPVLVEEDSGVFGAFGRSRYLTKGVRWRVFGIELVTLVLYWLATAVFGMVLLMVYGVGGMVSAVQTSSLPYLLLTVVFQTVIAAVWAAIQTSLYVELRIWKDGPSTAALTDVFA